MNIFLTGGTGGIGQEIIRALSDDPDNLIYFTYHHQEAQARVLEKKHSNAKPIYCDLSKEEEIKRVRKSLSAVEFDVIIVNAFPKVLWQDFYKTEWQAIEHNMQVGVRSAFEFIQSFSKAMKKKKRGQIITILSSVVLETPPAQMAGYVIAKYALLGLHNLLAADLTKYGIKIHALSPAMVKTDFISLLPEHYVTLTRESMPGKELISPQDIANRVQSLMKDAAQIQNGANIPLRQTERSLHGL